MNKFRYGLLKLLAGKNMILMNATVSPKGIYRLSSGAEVVGCGIEFEGVRLAFDGDTLSGYTFRVKAERGDAGQVD